jgi:septal ring factor EnvC (AmiA/AmiB activator)
MSRVLKTLVIISLLLGGFLSHAQDSKRKELENRRFELQQEIKRINALRTSNLKKQKSVLTQVEDLDTQISTTERLIKVTNQLICLLET